MYHPHIEMRISYPKEPAKIPTPLPPPVSYLHVAPIPVDYKHIHTLEILSHEAPAEVTGAS